MWGWEREEKMVFLCMIFICKICAEVASLGEQPCGSWLSLISLSSHLLLPPQNKSDSSEIRVLAGGWTQNESMEVRDLW